MEIHAEIEDGVIDPIGISIIHEPIDDDYYHNLANTVCVKLACNMFDTKNTQGYFDRGLFNSAFNWMAKNYEKHIALIAIECLKNIRRIEDNKIQVDKSAQNVMAKMAISGCWASFKAEWDIRLDKITNRDAFDKELDELATNVCEDISLNSKNYNNADFIHYFFNSIKIPIEELSEKLTTAPDDQYGLGYAYYLGQGVDEDYEQAFAWFLKSAEQGYAEAHLRLGHLYFMGQGVDQDDEQAFAWVCKSAEQGYAKGQSRLGYLYYFGQGVDQDYKQAFAWYNKSAEQGNAEGQFRLGYLYLIGQGVDQDDEQAFAWFRKSAEQGNAEGQFWLGFFYYFGNCIDQDYEQAFSWFLKSAEQGEVKAYYRLGYLYSLGQGVDKDYEQAYNWFRKSAEQGDAEGQFRLGYLYHIGQGVDQDYKQAFAWYNKSAEQGNLMAITERDKIKHLQ